MHHDGCRLYTFSVSAEEKPKPVRGPLRTPSQVARRLGVSRDTVMEYYDSRELEGGDFTPRHTLERVRRGARAPKRIIRFRDEQVDAFEENRFRAAEIAAARRDQRESTKKR